MGFHVSLGECIMKSCVLAYPLSKSKDGLVEEISLPTLQLLSSKLMLLHGCYCILTFQAESRN